MAAKYEVIDSHAHRVSPYIGHENEVDMRGAAYPVPICFLHFERNKWPEA